MPSAACQAAQLAFALCFWLFYASFVILTAIRTRTPVSPEAGCAACRGAESFRRARRMLRGDSAAGQAAQASRGVLEICYPCPVCCMPACYLKRPGLRSLLGR